VDLLGQVELSVGEIEVLLSPSAVGETADCDSAEDRRKWAIVAGLDASMELATCVAHLVDTRLLQRTQVEVILVELADELAAVDVEARLQLGVSELCRLVSGQKADDTLVERIGGREGARRFIPGAL